MAQLLYQRYELLSQCGKGGSADVFKARDTRLHRVVALKRVRGRDPAVRHRRALRLLKEAEYLGSLDHINVVRIHDCIVRQTSVTLVLELVGGRPFQDLFAKRPVGEAEFLGYLRQMLSAMEAVHAEQILHRDVNPRNILVTPQGTIKLMDFGLASSARATEHRSGGSIGYMAPEALRRGRKIDFGVDIYGIGFLSYQALLSNPEFQRLYGTSNPTEWARWMLSREKFRTLLELGTPVSPGLSRIVGKMLEKDPKERYRTATDVRKDLEKLEGEGK
jgi:serine/threonine protein kinase